jgi:hypothetical protein
MQLNMSYIDARQSNIHMYFAMDKEISQYTFISQFIEDLNH